MTARTREAVRYSLLVFVGVRLALFVLGLVAAGAIKGLDPVSVPGWRTPPVTNGWDTVFTAWERFDALWFLRIASAGYRPADGSAAFFPLFPLLVRAVSFSLGGRPFAAGMIVANVAFAAALCILYLLTAVFPSALFFFAPYTEPVFLLFVLVSFRAARHHAWFVAGVAAGLAALTRSAGVALAPALAVEALQQWREGGRSPLAGLSAALSPFAGVGLYLLYWYAKVGDALTPIDQQANWQRSFSWPWATLFHATRDVVDYAGRPNGGYWLIDWLIVVPVIGAAVYAAIRYRPSFGTYTWAALLIPLFYIFPPRPLMSMPRFVLPLFPAMWALADVTERSRVPRAAVLAVSAAGLGCLVVLFVNWYYIF